MPSDPPRMPTGIAAVLVVLPPVARGFPLAHADRVDAALAAWHLGLHLELLKLALAVCHRCCVHRLLLERDPVAVWLAFAALAARRTGLWPPAIKQPPAKALQPVHQARVPAVADAAFIAGVRRPAALARHCVPVVAQCFVVRAAPEPPAPQSSHQVRHLFCLSPPRLTPRSRGTVRWRGRPLSSNVRRHQFTHATGRRLAGRYSGWPGCPSFVSRR